MFHCEIHANGELIVTGPLPHLNTDNFLYNYFKNNPEVKTLTISVERTVERIQEIRIAELGIDYTY